MTERRDIATGLSHSIDSRASVSRSRLPTSLCRAENFGKKSWEISKPLPPNSRRVSPRPGDADRTVVTVRGPLPKTLPQNADAGATNLFRVGLSRQRRTAHDVLFCIRFSPLRCFGTLSPCRIMRNMVLWFPFVECTRDTRICFVFVCLPFPSDGKHMLLSMT